MIKTLGNNIKGKAIPFINPYCDSAKLEECVNLVRLRGIRICFIVDRLDLIIDVTAMGNDIFNNLFK